VSAGSSAPVRAAITNDVPPLLAQTDVASAPASIVGDADCSGELGPSDVLAILGNHVCDGDAADANCDGIVSIIDALDVLRHLAGLAAVSPGAQCTAGDALVIGASTEKLIDDAITAGHIGANTGLIYKTFAVYGDNRLPAEYVGDRRRPMDHSVLETAHEALASMSPADQALLAPFFVPPAYKGSWTDRLDGTTQAAAPQVIGPPVLKDNWKSEEGLFLRVWYAQDPPDCGLFCLEGFAQLEAGQLIGQEVTIESKLTSLMNKEPLYAPGDDRLNVFLVDFPPGTYGATTTIGDGCQHKPTYIQLGLNRFGPNIVAIFTHEFMHAIQFAFSPASCTDYEWWAEATAQFAIQYVYPKDNTEHWVPYGNYLGTTDQPIENRSAAWVAPQDPGTSHDAGARAYAAYVLPWFMAFKYHDPDAVRRSWENSSGTADSLAAINAALDGGWKAHWADFQVANWNRSELFGGPLDNISNDYQLQDELTFGDYARHYNIPDGDVKLNGQPTVTFPQIEPIQHLAAKHYWYKFSDPAVNSVQFFNDYDSKADKNIKVQALIKIEGDPQWKQEDWSDEYDHIFCRSKPEQRVEELVIIVSNATYDDRTKVSDPGHSRLVGSAPACAYQGTASFTFHSTAFQGSESTTSGTVVFIAQDDPQTNGIEYVALGGSLRHTFSNFKCHGDGTTAVADGSLIVYPDTGHYLGAVTGEFVPAFSNLNNEPCTGQFAGEAGTVQIGSSEIGRFVISPDGRTLDGSYTTQADDQFGHSSWDYSWHLTTGGVQAAAVAGLPVVRILP
jgi:hypothetical protein